MAQRQGLKERIIRFVSSLVPDNIENRVRQVAPKIHASVAALRMPNPQSVSTPKITIQRPRTTVAPFVVSTASRGLRSVADRARDYFKAIPRKVTTRPFVGSKVQRGIDVAQDFATEAGQGIARSFIQTARGIEDVRDVAKTKLTGKKPTFKTKAAFIPETKTEKLIFGDDPVDTLQDRYKYNKKYGKNLGLNDKAASTIALAGTAFGAGFDIVPDPSGLKASGKQAGKKLLQRLVKETNPEAVTKLLRQIKELKFNDDILGKLSKRIAQTTDEATVRKTIKKAVEFSKLQSTRAPKAQSIINTPDNRVFVRTEPRAKGQLIDPSKSLKLKGGKVPPLPKIPDEIMKTQQGAEVWQEMAESLAGKRIYAQDADKWISQKSTFPEWVSESLRSRELFDQVQKHLLDGTTPKRGSKAGDLYQEVWARMAGDSKILTSELPRANSSLEPSLDDLNATIPNKINLTGKVRKVKTDSEFESLVKTMPVELRDQKRRVELEDFVLKQPTPANEKVNLLDWVRTPDRVLQKIGLAKEAKVIRNAWDSYKKELPQEIKRVTSWAKRVSPEGNQRIFQFLDGQTGKESLQGEELKVVKEIRSYLEGWADRLSLPKEGRVTNYITHIFDQELAGKEFDDDLAKILTDKVAGSVYDPFTQKRLGKLGYVEDTWRALDAYVKRAVRKANMDPALEMTKKAAEKLEQSQFDYVKNYVDRLNMRPTKLDNLLDNTIKTVFGYRFGVRPTAHLTRKARQWVYRGTLGLNPGSALRNLSQGANTYKELGEKYTLRGYTDIMKNFGSDELERVGVLADDFIEDRALNATKKFWEKTDKVLFSLFEFAEKVNRGAAYYGAKARALDKGMSEEQAIQAAKELVRKTQFTFGAIDTPLVLQNDIMKTVAQLQSFTLKQGEFLGEAITKKDIAGLVRYTVASLIFVNTIGELFGMDLKEIIPSLRFGGPPAVRPIIETGKAVLNTPDRYGNERDLDDKLGDIGDALIPYVPAGVQMKKSAQGYAAVQSGGKRDKRGRLQYEIAIDFEKMQALVFGPSATDSAENYYANRGKKDKKKSKIVAESKDDQKRRVRKGSRTVKRGRKIQVKKTKSPAIRLPKREKTVLLKNITTSKRSNDSPYLLPETKKSRRIKIVSRKGRRIT